MSELRERLEELSRRGDRSGPTRFVERIRTRFEEDAGRARRRNSRALAGVAIAVALVVFAVVIAGFVGRRSDCSGRRCIPTPAAATFGWSVTETPHPTASLPSGLEGVSCPSPTSCFAIGDAAHGQTLIEHWDGISWARMASPKPTRHPHLFGVSCPSASSCFAVGVTDVPAPGHTPSGNSVDINVPLIERWNGNSWTIMTSPNPVGLYFLTGVSCPSPSSCFAVGRARHTVVEHWDGTRWSMMTGAASSYINELWSVSCPTTTSCFAVGDYPTAPSPAPGQRTLIEHWNGSRWAIMTGVPSPSTFDHLAGVSCASTKSCVAVGLTTASGASTARVLVEHWNGTRWSTMTGTPNPSTYDYLEGVSCPSPTSCFAVGRDGPFDRVGNDLVEHWSGRGGWTIMPNPNPSNGSLLGLSCPSTTSCYAVGSAWGTTNGHGQRTLAERYTP